MSAKSTTGTTIHARMRLRNRTPMRSGSAAGHRASLATSRTGGRAASAFAVSGATSTRRLSRSRTLFGTPLPVLGSPARDFRGAAAVVGSRSPVMTDTPDAPRKFPIASVSILLDEPSNETTSAGPAVQPACLERVRGLHYRHHLPPVAAADGFAVQKEGLKRRLRLRVVAIHTTELQHTFPFFSACGKHIHGGSLKE